MKVLFADVDGVLATPKSYKTILSVPVDKEHCIDKDYNSFSAKAVANLNKIIKATDAKIVISSTWRKLYSLEALQSIFVQEGIKGEVIGLTPILNAPFGRGEEILEWIELNSVPERYAVIDDDVHDILDYHPNNTVYVMGGWGGGAGLLAEHAKQTIEILQGA